MKILIIEDDPYFSQALKERLEDRGYTTQLVNSIDDALAVPTEGLSAIISDVMLPNDPAKSGISDDETRAGYLSGVAFFRSIRQKGLKIPLFFLTNSNTSGDAANWAAKEHIPFISKTDGPDSILLALEAAGLATRGTRQKATKVPRHQAEAVQQQTPDSNADQRSEKSLDGEPPDWLKGIIWFRRRPWYLAFTLGGTLFVYVVLRLTGHDLLCPLLERVGLKCSELATTRTNYVMITNSISLNVIDPKTDECIAYAKDKGKPYWIESITEIIHLQFDKILKTRTATFQVVYVLRLLRDVQRNDQSFKEWFNTSDQRARLTRISGTDEESVHGANGKFEVQIAGRAGEVRTVVTGGRYVWPYDAEPRAGLGDKIRLGKNDDTWNYPNDSDDAIREYTMLIYSDEGEIRS